MGTPRCFLCKQGCVLVVCWCWCVKVFWVLVWDDRNHCCTFKNNVVSSACVCVCESVFVAVGASLLMRTDSLWCMMMMTTRVHFKRKQVTIESRQVTWNYTVWKKQKEGKSEKKTSKKKRKEGEAEKRRERQKRREKSRGKHTATNNNSNKPHPGLHPFPGCLQRLHKCFFWCTWVRLYIILPCN